MNKFFYLNPDHTIRPCSIHEWVVQFEEMSKNDTNHVAWDEINGKRISTVWLGLNHNCFGGKPLIFETMVFGERRGHEEYIDRYSTWDETVEGHKKAIEWVLNGCIEE